VAGAAGTTASLAAFALDTPFTELPAPVVATTRRIIVDTIAWAVGAVETEAAQAVLAVRRTMGGRAEATLPAFAEKLPVPSVAYVGAQLANILDADETLLNRSHFASCIVMPAVAAAEWVGACGEELIAAVAVGFDVASRVGFSLAQYEVVDGDVRWSSVFGFDWAAFGTAAAVGRLMGLTYAQLENAFGTTFVSTPVNYDMRRANGPLFSRPGTQLNWHKYAMYGAIAEAGVHACLLAARGFRADRTILDDESNFWMSFGATGCDRAFLLRDLGSRLFISETSIKPWPFCRYGHSALDMFAEIVTGHDLTSDEIEEIEVRIPPFDVLQAIVGNVPPDDPFKVMMNLPFASA
jgi:2-methylcitrate dehydratase PrpD